MLFSSETLLLWIAVGIAVVFLGLLVYDFVRRRKHRRRHRGEPESLRAKLLKRLRRAQAFKGDLEQILQERSRRNQRDRREPPKTRP
jgi:peptidoglycan/LPS O-acetylase OafA/YrhL